MGFGATIAIPVAAAREVFAVVLESPMTSILDVARYRMGRVPFSGMIRYPFRPDLLIGEITAPIPIMHGSKDKVIPFALGRRLAALAPSGTRFVAIEGAGHNDLRNFGTPGTAIAFFKEMPADTRRSEVAPKQGRKRAT